MASVPRESPALEFTYSKDYDKTLIRRDSESVAPTPGIYVWSIPEKGISIEISLDVVDRLLHDVMRGFGAVPRRGAEVGGVLLGSTTRPDGKLAVHIEDFELVTIEYRRGPSFLLSAADQTAFAEAVARARSGAGENLGPVGLFRSNTRDSVGLGQEDLELIDQHFPEPDNVVLMIKPYGTRVSMAGFYIREGGKFPLGSAPTREFPFRRKELAPDEPRPERSRAPERTATRPVAVVPVRTEPELVPAPEPEPKLEKAVGVEPPIVAAPIIAPPIVEQPIAQPIPPAEAAPLPVPTFASLSTRTPKMRTGPLGFLWAPLSFLFLLLGLLLGFEAAQAVRPGPPPNDPFRLALNVSGTGESLNVRWDRQSFAIRTAQRGLLTIDDGSYSKIVDLDATQLHNGSVVYRHDSPEVKFRLEVFPADRTSVAETLEWKHAAR